MSNPAPLIAVLCAATLGAGCGGGGAGRGGPFTIVAHDEYAAEPYHGTFVVTQGSYELGCSEGTVLDHRLAGAEEFGPEGVLQVFTCMDGKRSGSFLIRWEERAFLGQPWQSRWKFHGGTRDYADVEGKGWLSVRVILHPRTIGVETLHGTARF